MNQALRLHRSGAVLLGLGVVLLVVGLASRWWQLRLLGVFCLLTLVMAALLTLGRPRHRVELELDAERVVVGEWAGGRLRVANLGARSMPGRLDLPIGDEWASVLLPSLAPGDIVRQAFDVPTDRRGVVRVGPASSVHGDPFALVGRTTRWTDHRQLFVHPRTIALAGRRGGLVHDLEGRATGVATSHDIDLHALREYVPGDDRRLVHWRHTAHSGQLLVRQFDESRQTRVAVVLDCDADDHLDPDEFELAVELAASVGVQALRERHGLVFIAAGRSLPAPHAQALLDAISGVQQGGPGLDGLSTLVSQRAAGASLVVLVTGSMPDRGQLRAALRGFESHARVVAITADRRATASVSTIAQASFVTVGDLDELPRALRRAMA